MFLSHEPNVHISLRVFHKALLSREDVVESSGNHDPFTLSPLTNISGTSSDNEASATTFEIAQKSVSFFRVVLANRLNRVGSNNSESFRSRSYRGSIIS